jgi:hypothetical protein
MIVGTHLKPSKNGKYFTILRYNTPIKDLNIYANKFSIKELNGLDVFSLLPIQDKIEFINLLSKMHTKNGRA